MLGVPKTTPRMDDSLEDSELCISASSLADLLQQEHTEQNQQRQKAHGPKSRGNQAWFPRVYPVEPHGMHFGPQQ